MKSINHATQVSPAIPDSGAMVRAVLQSWAHELGREFFLSVVVLFILILCVDHFIPMDSASANTCLFFLAAFVISAAIFLLVRWRRCISFLIELQDPGFVFELTPRGMRVGDMSRESEIAWSSIVDYREFGDFIFFYPLRHRPVYMLPKKGLLPEQLNCIPENLRRGEGDARLRLQPKLKFLILYGPWILGFCCFTRQIQNPEVFFLLPFLYFDQALIFLKISFMILGATLLGYSLLGWMRQRVRNISLYLIIWLYLIVLWTFNTLFITGAVLGDSHSSDSTDAHGYRFGLPPAPLVLAEEVTPSIFYRVLAINAVVGAVLVWIGMLPA